MERPGRVFANRDAPEREVMSDEGERLDPGTIAALQMTSLVNSLKTKLSARDEEIALLKELLESRTAVIRNHEATYDTLYAALGRAVTALQETLIPLKALQLADGHRWSPEVTAQFAKAEPMALAVLNDAAAMAAGEEWAARDEEIARLMDRIADLEAGQRNDDRDYQRVTAALGRAVAALRRSRVFAFRGSHLGGCCDCEYCSAVTEIDAILADETCAAAGDYVAALEREHEAMKAYRDAVLNKTEATISFKDVADAIAAVDARKAVKP